MVFGSKSYDTHHRFIVLFKEDIEYVQDHLEIQLNSITELGIENGPKCSITVGIDSDKLEISPMEIKVYLNIERLMQEYEKAKIENEEILAGREIYGYFVRNDKEQVIKIMPRFE